MPAPVLSILNMKGGVGKTTISAHVIRVLYHRHQKRVLLIDLDPQFNLTQAVLTQEDYDKIVDEKSTVMAAFEPQPSNDFFQVQSSKEPPPEAKNLAKRLRKIGKGEKAALDILPGSFDLMKYTMIDDAAQLKIAADHFKWFISNARDEYDLIVLDCNPSSSFVTKCALENSTSVLSPVKPDKFSILGVGMVDRLFEHLGIAPIHMTLINGVRRHDPVSVVELELRAHEKFGQTVLNQRLPVSTHLEANASYTGFATDRGGPYSGVLRTEIGLIAREIVDRLGVWQ
ncbi:MAG: ParA family protein [Marinomonas sp.]